MQSSLEERERAGTNRPMVKDWGLGPWLVLGYALLAWVLLSDQWLPFPHGADDQLRAALAAGGAVLAPRDSWIAEFLDPIAARLFPESPYAILQVLRRTSVTAALVGMVVWIGRGLGWAKGFWTALLVLSLLPPRHAGIALAPQGLALGPLVWGFALVLGRPWSKTGGAEITGGGLLLGVSAFAAPWAWLFVASLPLRAAFSRDLARRLDSGFWAGLLLGAAPGIAWAFGGDSGVPRDIGLRLETLAPSKLPQIFETFTHGWGRFACVLVLVGILCERIARPHGGTRWAITLSWPVIPLVVFGIADPVWTSLALPGLALYALEGLSALGKVFVSRTERLLLPTLLVGVLAYHSYFTGLESVRAWQGYARSEAALARLVLAHVRPGQPIILFRLDPILEYLKALQPSLDFPKPTRNPFETDSTRWTANLERLATDHAALWVEPRALASLVGDAGEPLEQIRQTFRVEVFVGDLGVELWKIHLRSMRQKNHTSIPQPGPVLGISTTPKPEDPGSAPSGNPGQGE